MDLFSTLRVVLRRWYLAVPLVFLCVATTYVAIGTSPAGYKTNASLLLLSPTTRLTPTGTGTANPYLQFGGTQTAVADVLVTSIGGAKSRRVLAAGGVVGDWNLARTGTDAPLIKVEVTAATSAAATQSAKTIVKTVEQRLLKLQVDAGSPPDQLITVAVIDAADRAAGQYGSTYRAAGALLVVLLGLSFGAIFAIEGAVRARRAEVAQRGDTENGREKPRTPSPTEARKRPNLSTELRDELPSRVL